MVSVGCVFVWLKWKIYIFAVSVCYYTRANTHHISSQCAVVEWYLWSSNRFFFSLIFIHFAYLIKINK